MALVVTLTAAAAYEALHLLALTRDEVWWHLRTGLWVLEKHAIPRTGLFSQFPSLPWIDSSWGFDLLTAIAYRLFGLAGLPVLLMILQVGVALAFFRLARGSRRNFWPAVVLAAIAQCSIAPVMLRPGLCSIALCSLELALLLQVRHTGNTRTLCWLPLVFLVWANVDRQFSYGLLALALLFIAVVAEQVCRKWEMPWFATGLPEIPPGTLAASAVACLLATLVTPYGYRLPLLLWRSAANTAIDRYFRELHSMRFRQPEDYLLMLLAMTAFFTLGRRHSRDLFLILLLLTSAVISFRLQRDGWLAVVASIAIIANAAGGEQGEVYGRARTWQLEKIATATLVLLVLIAVALRIPSQDALLSKVSGTFPRRACDYIRDNHLPQPLFNTYPWGGFLTWYLPEYPVYIDSRADRYGELYGGDIIEPYFKLLQAEIPLQSHSGFANAETFLLEANSPLGQALAALPGFRVAYKDDQAMVLVRGG